MLIEGFLFIKKTVFLIRLFNIDLLTVRLVYEKIEIQLSIFSSFFDINIISPLKIVPLGLVFISINSQSVK